MLGEKIFNRMFYILKKLRPFNDQCFTNRSSLDLIKSIFRESEPLVCQPSMNTETVMTAYDKCLMFSKTLCLPCPTSLVKNMRSFFCKKRRVHYKSCITMCYPLFKNPLFKFSYKWWRISPRHISNMSHYQHMYS